ISSEWFDLFVSFAFVAFLLLAHRILVRIIKSVGFFVYRKIIRNFYSDLPQNPVLPSPDLSAPANREENLEEKTELLSENIRSSERLEKNSAYILCAELKILRRLNIWANVTKRRLRQKVLLPLIDLFVASEKEFSVLSDSLRDEFIGKEKTIGLESSDSLVDFYGKRVDKDQTAFNALRRRAQLKKRLEKLFGKGDVYQLISACKELESKIKEENGVFKRKHAQVFTVIIVHCQFLLPRDGRISFRSITFQKTLLCNL
ncbi:hypothetical protein MHBO_002200, partial [Bonamia ostreae]